jgi:PAP2 superfamily
LHIGDSDSPLRSPRFYLALGAAGALWGGSFVLDQTMRASLRHMSRGAHDVMENLSYTCLISGVSLQYVYGLYRQDERARDYALTAMMGAGFGVLANLALEASFGRLRPFQSSSHTAFFHKVGAFNAGSFTSEDIVITSAMATGVSEYFDNKWYVAAPLYSLVLTEGFTRIGSDQNWFSDVVAGGLLGWSITELLLRLHKNNAVETTRWRIFPIISPRLPARNHSNNNPLPMGLGIAYSW